MKKIFILTVVMGIGMMFLSQDAKAQVANSSNINTPITGTVTISIPTGQTQNGVVTVNGVKPPYNGPAPAPRELGNKIHPNTYEGKLSPVVESVAPPAIPGVPSGYRIGFNTSSDIFGVSGSAFGVIAKGVIPSSFY